jgi:hypothetical protein
MRFGQVIEAAYDIVAREIGIGESKKKFVRTVTKQSSEIVSLNQSLVNNRIDLRNLMLTSGILALYRLTNLKVKNNDKAIGIIRQVLEREFVKTIDEYLLQRFDIHPDKPQESFDKIAHNFVVRGQRGFGAGFTYEPDVKTANRAWVNISRCFFHDFFRRNEAPELTQVMCALDIVWAKKLKAEGHNVRFERPVTMAEGGEVCQFHFYKVKTGDDFKITQQ